MSPARDTNGVVIGVSTRIQLGLLIALIGGITSAVLAWATLDARVARIEEKLSAFVEELRAERLRTWTHDDQDHFTDLLESRNQGLNVPKIRRGG